MEQANWYQFLKPQERADLSDSEAEIEARRNDIGAASARRKRIIDRAIQRMRRAGK